MRKFKFFTVLPLILIANNVKADPNDIVINEIAWMGTTVSVHDEWIELHNTTNQDINLTGWSLTANDQSPQISLVGTITAGGYFLLERQDDNTVQGFTADQLYTGALQNTGQGLELRDANGGLIDAVSGWFAGDVPTKATMERTSAFAQQWNTSTTPYQGGFGTPKSLNSQSVPVNTSERINQVSNAVGAVNVYFNNSALTAYAATDNLANYQVNLEHRLIKRINEASQSIDVATYEINLPDMVDALIDRAAAGITVRILVDSKAPGESDPDYIVRYEVMRLYLEKLVRGRDGNMGTADDSHLFADSIIFAIEDPLQRQQFALPLIPVSGLTQKTVQVGTETISGYLLAEGEQKPNGNYYSPGAQMHNKFLILDQQWVWTGSWNFTVTGLYGSEENRLAGRLQGNSQHAIEIHSSELAAAYTLEFDEMWGDNGNRPNPQTANLHARKQDNTPHSFMIGGRNVELYFSPGDNPLGHFENYIRDHADHSALFTIFAWSDQNLVNELKQKWEGNKTDLQGSLTGFEVKGIFDGSFWNQWWSASIDMTGRTASQISDNNPNTRWANPAPVFPAREVRKLHSKTMIIDVCTNSDPTTIIGSTNWSANGNDVNDENLLMIHDANIANQFLQEFYARYENAGGELPATTQFNCVVP